MEEASVDPFLIEQIQTLAKFDVSKEDLMALHIVFFIFLFLYNLLLYK